MNDRRSHHPVFRLADDAAAGLLTDADADRLLAMLEQDRAARDIYTDYFLMHAQLGWLAGAQQATARALADIGLVEPAVPRADPIVDILPAPRPGGSFEHLWQGIVWRRHPLRFLACAAVLTALFWLPIVWMVGGGWHGGPKHRAAPPSQEAPFVARLVASENARWEDRATAPFPKQYLRAGDELRLAGGAIELEFLNHSSTSRARVWLEGPAVLRLDSGSVCHLLSGAVACNVPEGCEGFVVDTPLARVTDLGTEFGVLVDRDSDRVESLVFQGQIEIAPHAPGTSPRRLAAGSSLRMSGDGEAVVRALAEEDRRWQRSIVGGAHRTRLRPASYDMPNGSHGEYTYFDTEYDGQGNLNTPEALLRGGRGLLTNRLFAVQSSGHLSDRGWVGWMIDPQIVFHFDEPVTVNEIVLSIFRYDGPGIRAPQRVVLSDDNGGGVTLEIDEGSERLQRLPFKRLGLHGRTITIEMTRRDKWIFCDEVEFFGAVDDEDTIE